MSSNNYAVLGQKFNLQGSFLVVRMEDFQSEMPDLLDIEDGGISTHPRELKALIAEANSLQFVDFGNGHIGLFAECPEFAFCAVRGQERSVGSEPKPEFRSASDDEGTF
jgi:hypothetical protein